MNHTKKIMTEQDTNIIQTEQYEDEQSSEQKLIFDINLFHQIRGKELDLSVDKILEVPIVRKWFRKPKEEFYVISQKEHIIDCKYNKGKAKILILNKKALNKEIQNIQTKNPIKYVHLGGTEILIKACFREGIDTPIEIYLADDRIVEPIEKSVISAVKGNLIYQKFKFIISANYSIAPLLFMNSNLTLTIYDYDFLHKKQKLYIKKSKYSFYIAFHFIFFFFMSLSFFFFISFFLLLYIFVGRLVFTSLSSCLYILYSIWTAGTKLSSPVHFEHR